MNDLADQYAKDRKNFNTLLDVYSDDIVPAASENKKSLKGKMSYGYGENKRPGLVSESTIEAVVKGERTATTRYSDKQAFQYWKNANKGDIIEWVSDTGESVKVVVTKPLHKLVGSGKTPNEWSQLEGWSVEYFNKVVRPKLDKAWQIEFEYIPNSYKPVQASIETLIQPIQDYSELNTFYNQLTEEQQKKLGTLDDVIEEYYEMYSSTMTEEQYIEHIKNCKL